MLPSRLLTDAAASLHAVCCAYGQIPQRQPADRAAARCMGQLQDTAGAVSVLLGSVLPLLAAELASQHTPLLLSL